MSVLMLGEKVKSETLAFIRSEDANFCSKREGVKRRSVQFIYLCLQVMQRDA